jgi:hypothetical protein
MSSISSNLVLKVMQRCWVCQGRFHGILPEEYSGTLHGLQWGLYEGHLLTHGVVTYLKYISANRLFFYKSY